MGCHENETKACYFCKKNACKDCGREVTFTGTRSDHKPIQVFVHKKCEDGLAFEGVVSYYP